MSAALGFVSEISEIIEYDGKLMENINPDDASLILVYKNANLTNTYYPIKIQKYNLSSSQ